MIYTFTFWQRFWHRRRCKQLQASFPHTAHEVLELTELPNGAIDLKFCSESYYRSSFVGKGSLRVGLTVVNITTWRCSGKTELNPVVVKRNHLHIEGPTLVLQINYAGAGFELRCRQLERLTESCYCIDEDTGETEPYEDAIRKMAENSGALIQLLKNAGAKKQGTEQELSDEV